ncbi:MAG: DUF2505 domain-containing protein [Brevibacterium sp.]|uniref:DUF2505 family protein n=1 Tax=Brevibacterium sp. TaxID=1701 RepID=UPI002648AE6C|nr:DUF2505 family protein [Brevibacterium sp.]MDN5806022.1 DUF2505 domain-containing protein [Brevibacterium sp.]MDN5832531.1 DUF2505 domain-containing protein [Brevibacterium sp.]MDN5875222.1 DUF2505 domain-containing protein [Brevibacterium sp.]MDN5908217.1 DUF2505 domain-containing protein [Brevibacterium sp.]MDN6123049.1 DUF2505 domain-containing protein [Brevibacterium sp.]
MRTLTLNHEYSDSLSAFLLRLADASTWESLGYEAQAERIDPDTEVTVKTPLPKSEMPAALASHLPANAELVEIYIVPGDVIGDSAEIRMTAHAAGVPVEIDALITLAQRDSGIALSVRAEISSSIPLFGPMVEQAVVPILQKRLDDRLHKLES